MAFLKLVVITLALVSLTLGKNSSCEVSDCTLLSQLECALLRTDENERKLNQAFFPPRKETTRYIRVHYEFKAEEDIDYYSSDSLRDLDIYKNCSAAYVWAIGGFLLIQPPGLFQLTSLLFSYPANDVDKLNLTLPLNCSRLINANASHCDCRNHSNNNLDILTQQVSSSPFASWQSEKF